MKVAVAINGSLIAEGAAIYAMQYASQLDSRLEVFHIQNPGDQIELVEASISRLRSMAIEKDIHLEVTSIEGEPVSELLRLTKVRHIDTLFCSTRAKKQFIFENSVADSLSRIRKRACHLAVVKIKKINSVYNCQKVGLFGRKGPPDIVQFNLGIGLTRSYNAGLVLGNSLNITQKKWENLAIHNKKNLLRKSDRNFKPYCNICQMMGTPFQIAHMLGEWNHKEIHDYLLSRKINLMILSVTHLPFFTSQLFKNKSENIFHQSPINCLILYPGDKGS